MTGISISEWGNRFVWAAFREYWGGCLFPVLFLAGLFWSLIRRKKGFSPVFLGYGIFLILTVYNPFFVKRVIPALGFEKEYYRFFWVLPVIPGAAYYLTKLVFRLKKKWVRLILAAGAACLIVLMGTPLQGVAENFAKAENLYKVPNDLRAVCDVIHQHSEKENPRVLFDKSLNFMACQYDPSLYLVLNRNVVLYVDGSRSVTVNTESKAYKRASLLINATYGQQPVKEEDFVKALVESKTDYMVMPVALTNHDFFKDSGCQAIAQTEHYVVYSFDWESRT